MCWTRLRSSCPAAHRGGLVEAVRIEHPLEPIYAVDSRVLVLGTMPSPKSREIGFYYGHPQNRFWKVMGALFRAARHRGTRGVSRCARHRSLGRSVVLHHRRSFGCEHRRPRCERSFAHCRGGAARSRVHHGLEGDGALSPLRRAATSRPCAHGTSFHQSCERAHAPRRSCESVFADSRNFGTPGRRRAMSFCEVVARFAGRRGREKEESWRHARGRVDS